MTKETCTKLELAQDLKREHGISERLALKIVSSLFGGIRHKVLVEGRRVELRGFGSFMRKNVSYPNRHNPKTGGPLEIQMSQKVHFKAGKKSKKRIF